MAAVLAVGSASAVSHRSAAALWGMLQLHRGPIEITVPGDGGREKRKGIKLHRASTFTADLVACRQSIPLTKPARTLRDLHRTAVQGVYRRAVRRALDLRLISNEDLEQEPDMTRSELERLFLRLCRRRRVPLPEVNARIGRLEVDFLWPEQRLIVEADGYRYHGNRAAFESDRAKDAELQRLGYRVLRFTHRQIRNDPDAIARAIRALLSAAQPRPPKRGWAADPQ